MDTTHLPKQFTPSRNLMRNLLTLIIVGVLCSLVGIFFAPERTWANILLAGYYLVGIGCGAAMFIALLYVSNAGWATVFRRVPEAMLTSLVAGGIVMLVVMMGIHSLYEWSRTDIVANDHVLQAKAAWLNVPFFIIRTILYLILWLAYAVHVSRLSCLQDEHGDVKYTSRSKTASAIFLVVFGLTFTLASMDWIMSLEPHWYSTIFGIYNLCGSFLSGLAAVTLVVLLLKRMGLFAHVISDQHLHNLGKLIFAFSTFWMYIWFSQYLLIWYANIPEEVTFLLHRQQGSWLIFTIINVVFNWLIPFVALLPAWTKKNEGLLLRVCILIMIGHWIDLFWMILPPFMPDAPVLNIWELAPMLSVIAGFFYLTFRTLSRRKLIPLGDPMLVESISQH